MLQGKRSRRVIAATLLTIMITNTLAPTVTYALTSGPTQPEATSFEPVDTTDMVNLQSGDFTYNIPLLEVPGPEGGYPLSLSYHAGIQPNEEASWVGLGWTLNPGAITRSVNGYPDDWYLPTNTNHIYWEGGQVKTYNVGVSIGIANTPASVNFGLSFSQDTYQGFGGSMSFGVGSRIGNTPLSLGVGVQSDPYGGEGGFFATAGAKYGPLGAQLSVNTNFQSLSVGFSGGVNGVLETSMSTGGGKPSLSVGGLTKWTSSTATPGIETSSSGFGLDIPTPVPGLSLSLGYSKTRYWIDKSTDIITHGSIYSSGWPEGAGEQVNDDIAYDTYSLLEDNDDKSFVDYSDPTTVQGGAYLDFDLYNVTAQGLGGAMRPYQFQGEVLGQNRKDENHNAKVTYFSPGVTDPHPQFRFTGDFSNSYRQDYNDYSNPALNLRLVDPPFDASPDYGTDYNNDGLREGFNNNMLAGTRHIDIGVRVQPSNCAGYNRADRYKSHMIDGFSITNASGVTYHYGLPAYSYGEENYQEKIDKRGGVYYNRGSKPDAYAYTWYLTSITGPDYVDRNPTGGAADGKAGEGDWGYWVNFEYGKWANDYVWRNPAMGFHRDDDNEFQNVSIGKKEVYYLNAIRTRTHVALFEKDVRLDGKGVSPQNFDKNSDGTYRNGGILDQFVRESMQLKKIYLLNTTDAAGVSFASANANVFDKNDVEAVGRAAMEVKSIRVIDLYSDYSLCPNTANSYDLDAVYLKKGKLTLKALKMRGKGGVSVLPPTRFEYDLTGDDRKYTTGVSYNWDRFTTTNGSFQVGDLIMRDGDPASYSGYIDRIDVSGNTYTYWLENNPYPGTDAITANVYATKNPPYNQYGYDVWGMYKSDPRSTIGNNESRARVTSKISSNSVDAWSLRKILSPLGSDIKIGYESDSYSNAVMSANYPFVTTRPVSGAIPPGTIGFTFRLDEMGGNKVSDFFQPGDQINFIAVQSAWLTGGQMASQSVQRVLDSRNFGQPVTVHSVDNNGYTVFLQWPNMENMLYVDKTQYYTEGGLWVNRPENYNITPNAPMYANLSVINHRNVFGGGIRVKSISSNDNLSGITTITTYDYNTPGTSHSSGVTTYEGNVLDMAPFEPPYNYLTPTYALIQKQYKKALYKSMHRLYSIAREIPPPGVMYEYVTVSNTVKNAAETAIREVEGATQYQFEVFRDNMIYRTNVGVGRTHLNSGSWGWMDTRNLTLQKYVQSIGLLKRTVQLDKKNGRKLSETINHYLHDGLETSSPQVFMETYKTRLAQYNHQGYLQERLSEVKELTNQTNANDNGVKATLSAREEFPCISTGQEVINYVNGTKSEGNNLAYDFYSGSLTKTVETDVYGNKFVTEVKPAYQVPVFSGMGLKMHGGKNMLTQTAAQYTYKVNKDDVNEKLGLVSANVTTWSNSVPVIDVDGSSQAQIPLPGIWRKQSSYNWMATGKTVNGITGINDFADFNWSAPGSSNANWKKTSEVTLYDVYSKTLEVKDMNNNQAATRMDYGSKRVTVTGGPAGYYEIAYSGAEDDGVNQSNNAFVKKENGIITTGTSTAHTGNKSLKLGVSGAKGFVYTANTDDLVPGRNYITSVWVKPVSSSASDVKLYYEVNGVVKDNSYSSGSGSAKVAGGWSLINLVIKGADIVAGATLKVGCRNDATAIEAYVDDFRFHPLNAATSAYVYDAFTGELTHVLDNNNLYTKYEYDATGRLVKTYREKIGYGALIAKEYQYNFGRATGVYTNTAQSGNFTAQCISPRKGSTVTYTIPEGVYFSDVSVDDANNKAKWDVNAYGQIYANNKGTCLFYNEEKSGNFTTMGCACGTIPKTVTYTVEAGKHSSEDNWQAAQDMATADLNANGQQYAQTHGGCTEIAKNVKLTLVAYNERPSSPSSITVTLYCSDGTAGPSFTFPTGNGSKDVYVPAGSYTLKFSVSPEGWNTCPCWSIDLNTGGHISNPRETMGAGFSVGTNYVLTASTIM
ncbi:DUF5977 domain-containing protein [Longitalea arenae]|uniref:DUF5977 domain-containing protein n=1 Tax=Longitalea arenae TaxID=2812558 RepID=UPI0019670A9B|nr:DUF5977 domain-containing protein [Longitalea arenae]